MFLWQQSQGHYITMTFDQKFIGCIYSLHADYAIPRESPHVEHFARALVVAMRSTKESDSYRLDERRSNWLLYDEVNYLNLQLRTNEELIGRLAVAATGYVQVIILDWVAGKFSSFIPFFYYLLLLANAIWDSSELYLLDAGHELLELVRVMAGFSQN